MWAPYLPLTLVGPGCFSHPEQCVVVDKDDQVTSLADVPRAKSASATAYLRGLAISLPALRIFLVPACSVRCILIHVLYMYICIYDNTFTYTDTYVVFPLLCLGTIAQ